MPQRVLNGAGNTYDPHVIVSILLEGFVESVEGHARFD